MSPVLIPPRLAGLLGLAAAFGLLIGLTGAYVPGEPEPRPNILGNPSMEIDQANEGNSVSLSSGTNAFVVDQWGAGFHSASATVSAQRVADAPSGFANSVKLTVGTGATVAAGDYLLVRQPIEGNELTNLALGTSSAQQACVSFWVKSSARTRCRQHCRTMPGRAVIRSISRSRRRTPGRHLAPVSCLIPPALG